MLLMAGLALNPPWMCLSMSWPRLGDSYPSQMLNVHVRLLLYRYSAATSPEGELLPFTVTELPVTPPSLMLRYPMTVMHELGPGSPVGHWVTSAGLMQVSLEEAGDDAVTGGRMVVVKASCLQHCPCRGVRSVLLYCHALGCWCAWEGR